MSNKNDSLPRRGFALFTCAGQVEVRTVNVTGLHELLGAACVTESMTGIAHVLPLERLASETTLAAKKRAYAKTISATAAERPQHTMPVKTAAAA